MTETDRLVIERACERLIAAYGHLIDGGEAARVADLFTADGVWESPEARFDGRDAIGEAFSRRQANASRRSRHVCTNVAVEVVSPDEATARCYFTLYRADGIDPGRPASTTVPVMVGDYVDRFVRTSDGWRFAQRRASVAFLEGHRE
jgi:ketosteroid isomerase-like protein